MSTETVDEKPQLENIKEFIRETLSNKSLQQFKDGFVFNLVLTDKGSERG